MKTNTLIREQLLPLLLAVFSGILLYFTGFPGPVALLVFFAPVPVVYILLNEKPLKGFVFSFVAWYIGYSWMFFVYTPMTGILFPFLFIFFIAVIVSLFSLLTIILRNKIHPLLWIFLFPSGFVLIEWIAVLSGMGLHGITASASISAVSWLSAGSSIGGSFFITFILRLIPAGTGVIIADRNKAIRIMSLTIISALVLSLTIFGIFHTSGPWLFTGKKQLKNNTQSLKTTHVRVAAIVNELPENILSFYKENNIVTMYNRAGHETYVRQMLDIYDQSIRRAAEDKAEIIAGPECSFFVPGFFMQNFTDWLCALSQEYSVVIIIGVWENITPANCAFIALPGGGFRKIDKHFLVPGYESNYYIPGSGGPVIIDAGKVTLSVKICYELNFPGTFRKMAGSGVNLLVSPSLDWRESSELHMYETYYRGVENGMALLRPCRSGITTITDPHGNIMAKSISCEEKNTYIVTDIPIQDKSGTFYTYTGNWIVYISIIIVIMSIIVSIYKINIDNKRKA